MRWNAAAFAARGYVVVATDFHGSIGYGQKFKEQISGDWGGLAYDDVMRATDAAEKLPFVDPGHTCAAAPASAGIWWTGSRATPIASSAWSPTTASSIW